MIQQFLTEVAAIQRSGSATEHSYRPALERLFNSLGDEITAINEPRREQVGAPDFVFKRGDIVIGHCEAKDLGVDVKKMKGANAEQKKRYVGALSNLIYTNCLDWIFYRDGEQVGDLITIGDPLMGVQPNPQRFAALEEMLRSFIAQKPQTITSSKKLAERMAGKAVLIKDILANALREDRDLRSELAGQYSAFKEHLIHDISTEDFADIYAETIAYGMFAARLHDTTLNDFSRQEALDLLPKSNPFLRNLFSFIAGPDLDERISWVIDDLAEIFQATNVARLMQSFGKTTQKNDPFLHFYETFLAAYNPKKRKARGVWYTPEPVVNFIVRAVDDVLVKEFGLPMGLADTSKVTVPWDTGQKDKKGKPVIEQKEVHRVQILDPATGTGTFLAEVIKHIAPRVKAAAPASWNSYVEKDLIPRLHGFEILMASYAMCHLKLDMMLQEYGYKPTASPPRLSVYLTNSLEEGEPANQTLPFAQWLSNEVKQANAIKRDMPIMCVIGNPPYSGESANKGKWIMERMEAYKQEPGGKEKLKERNPKWINDDYVKFIRFAEHLIEKRGYGVLGFITNHGYLDNPTFRGMRWHLLKTFDKIYVLDLHGNAKKKEVSPDGSPDKNVFDIQQGVAIIIAVKKEIADPKIQPLAEVFHGELWGDRKSKYEALWNTPNTNTNYLKLEQHKKYYMYYEINNELLDTYDKSLSITDLFVEFQIAITTSRDELAISFDYESIESTLRLLASPLQSEEEIRSQFFGQSKGKDGRMPGDTATWSLADARRKIGSENRASIIKPISYRPFDSRFLIYSDHILERSRREIIPQMFNENICFSFNRKIDEERAYSDIFVFDRALQLHSLSLKESNYFAPLYLYPLSSDLDQTRRVNFDPKLYGQLREKAGVRPSSPVYGGGVRAADGGGGDLAKKPPSSSRKNSGPTLPPQAGEDSSAFTGAAPGEEANEIDVFDYIYGVLHCPAYRETFAEFLKIDFPRIPWPKSPDVFWNVREKGEQLRRLHLMEDAAIGETPFPFEGEGDSVIEKPEFRDGRVYVNKAQYFANAPQVSWGFYIGGYQPAQKWLKDRKGRELTFDDVRHYQKILKILAETDRIMKTIEMPL